MSTPPLDRAAELREVNRITLIGSAVDALLGIGKIAIGLSASSHALVADGIHSLTDLATDAGVLIVARTSRADPDAAHPYGHARFETLGSLVLGAILLIVAGGLAQDSAGRLFAGETAMPGMAALFAAGVSVVAKEWIFRITRTVAQRLGSKLLLANAWHSRSDAMSSVAVLIGVAGAMAGWVWLDLVAAMVVAAMIGGVGWSLIADAARELVDTGMPAEELEAVRGRALEIPGVLGVHQLRSRRMGAEALLDLDVEVGPTLSVSEGHRIATAVSQALISDFPEITDVTVHVDPAYANLDPVAQAPGEASDDDVTDHPHAVPLEADAEAMLRAALPASMDAASLEMTLHHEPSGVSVDLFLSKQQTLNEPGAQALLEHLHATGLTWVTRVQTWIPGAP